MKWVVKAIIDFFTALGFLVFTGFVVVTAFFDGKVENVNLGWFFFLPLVFAYLRGVFFHWPQESDQ